MSETAVEKTAPNQYYKIPKHNESGDVLNTFIQLSPMRKSKSVVKLQEIETLKLQKYRIESHPILNSVIDKPEVDAAAFLWRLNADIETKFALGRNLDTVCRSSLAEFML